jgi:hypothetical protein
MTSWRFWAKTTPDSEPGISVRSQLRESHIWDGENWHEQRAATIFTTRLYLSSTAAWQLGTDSLHGGFHCAIVAIQHSARSSHGGCRSNGHFGIANGIPLLPTVNDAIEHASWHVSASFQKPLTL